MHFNWWFTYLCLWKALLDGIHFHNFFMNLRKKVKVHVFWESNNFLRNLHRVFVLSSNGQIYDGDFSNIFGLLRIYELYCFEPQYWHSCWIMDIFHPNEMIIKKLRQGRCFYEKILLRLIHHILSKVGPDQNYLIFICLVISALSHILAFRLWNFFLTSKIRNTSFLRLPLLKILWTK